MNAIAKNTPVTSSITNENTPVNKQQSERKYEFTDDCEYMDGHFFYRIRALRDFGDVKKGDLGGYIEKEENLSHGGNCWVYDKARVFQNARVFGNAKLSGNSYIHSNASLTANEDICDDAYPKFGSEDDYYRHEYYDDCEGYYDDDNDSEYESDAA
ncbi:hypothetical protein HNQ69_001702 [Bartonella callosciuri]|uniref:Phage related protein n=1 Tax=Bartonella callosciuri TaxID=686223 RepID=A0A840NRU5_9HYPH|nr:hypothetical protein [Bartonella callosciuri]MBB5074550.1 hypothetical protein [Bartonella callosciuri]